MNFYKKEEKILTLSEKAQNKRRVELIQALLAENSEYEAIQIPRDIQDQKKLLRSLMNVRSPKPIASEILDLQDTYLQEELSGHSITSLDDLQPIEKNIYLWQGDITTLKCDAIVNAANSGLTGCYIPCHQCID